MSKPLSKDAFAIKAFCPYTGKQYGTSSQVASRSSSAGDTSKQDQVIEQIKEEAADVKGVEMADIGSQSYADEFR